MKIFFRLLKKGEVGWRTWDHTASVHYILPPIQKWSHGSHYCLKIVGKYNYRLLIYVSSALRGLALK